ncbi:MAG: ECF transporter S component [Clostridia bacterium]|nr:ECF transporter S component [Clostridia bacterium]
MSVISKKHTQLVRLATTGVCTALYFVLSMWATIPIGNVRITVAPLVLIVVGALYGPIDAAAAGFLAQFLKQIISYGMTATTFLWTVPDLVRGLIIGLVAWLVFRKGKYLEQRRILFVITCFVSALVTTALNTVDMGLDAWIYNYFTWSYVVGDLAVRLPVGVATSVVLCIVSIPVLGALRRNGFGLQLPEKEKPDTEKDPFAEERREDPE